MRELPIMQYPGLLRMKSAPVTVFDERLENLARDMMFTVNKHFAYGLAAIQVGFAEQVVVISKRADSDTKNVAEDRVFINPKILERDGEQMSIESCLSLAGVKGTVKRSKEVYVEYQDVTGETFRLVATGPLASVVQHECDHLEGRLFIDLGPRLQRKLVEERFLKMQKKYARAERRFDKLPLEERVRRLEEMGRR